jgi:hypothetical protein
MKQRKRKYKQEFKVETLAIAKKKTILFKTALLKIAKKMERVFSI